MIKLSGALPENVNFAIKGSVAEAFLDAHGVEYQTSPSTKRMETADIAEQAGKFTFRVECRNPAPSSEASSTETKIALGHQEDIQSGTKSISPGKKVSLEFTLILDDGTHVQSNVGQEPMVYTHGAQQIIPGLERQLLGMRVGERKRIVVLPEEGYGPVDPKRTQEVEIDKIPEEARKVGAKLTGRGPQGQMMYAEVKEIKGDTAVLDLNHPLAGKKLTFDVKVLKVEQ